MQIKPLGKLVIFILVLGIAVGAWRLFGNKLAPEAATKNAVVPGKVDLPTNAADSGAQGSIIPVSADIGCSEKPEVRLLGYAWNAQMGMLYAIGGPQSTRDGLMCKRGVNLKFARQDDNGKLQEALVSFATELSQNNANPAKGAHFVTIMGDGAAVFITGLNQTLSKLGPEYQAKIVDVIGYSRGEDKLMGPAEWKTNPGAAKGSLVAGVVRDGDWNIAQKWLGDNGIPTNPDEKTYDPNAMNWVNASDYIDAAQKYVAGYSEDRPVVVNGKKTGETKHIAVNGIVTWTPGDVTAAEKKGGLVSVVSTKEYSSQMPCVVIGIDKWMKSNRPTVTAMIQAIAQGSEAVNANPAALSRAAQVSHTVYHESGTDPAYWAKYYTGTVQKDATGQMVDLGGSKVSTLADTMIAFGLVPGSADLVSATYTVFGNVVHSQFPELLPAVPPAAQVIDKSYVQDAAKSLAPAKSEMAAARPKYTAPIKPANTANVVGKRAWNIHFNPAQATFSPDAKNLLNELSSDLLVASGTVVEIHGYTDNQGSSATSLPLLAGTRRSGEAVLGIHAPGQLPERACQSVCTRRSKPGRRQQHVRRPRQKPACRNYLALRNIGNLQRRKALATTQKGAIVPDNKPIIAGASSNAALAVGDKAEDKRRQSPLTSFVNAFLPNRAVSPTALRVTIAVEALIALLLWVLSPFKVLPRPDEVFHALQNLWMTEGLGRELATSFQLNLEALAWSAGISLVLSYLTVIPVFRPLVAAISKGRFLSIVGFTFVFTLVFGGGHALKTSLLVFAVTVFYVTSMAAVIAAIPKENFDYARTLRMSEWRVVWEVVVIGTADKAFEVLRQNAAIGWMMLTMVEGIVRSEGGVGAMLLSQSKHFLLPEVFAIQLVILAVGLLQDAIIIGAQRIFCPYADLTLERK